MAQNSSKIGSKMDPEWLNMAPRWSKMNPRLSQDGSTWLQDGSMLSPGWLNMREGLTGSRMVAKSSTRFQDGPT
eukprot:8105949-Karenia_brevis.AAC.1